MKDLEVVNLSKEGKSALAHNKIPEVKKKRLNQPTTVQTLHHNNLFQKSTKRSNKDKCKFQQ
jgi:hypothetical protein